MGSWCLSPVFGNERSGRDDDTIRLIAMRGMPAFRDFEQLASTDARRNAVDLRERAVLVVDTLDGQHRAADGVELSLDVPFAKRQVQPDAVPAPEGRIGAVVIAAELLRQVGAQVGGAGL